MDWSALEYPRRAGHLSQILVRRNRLRRRQISADLGRVPRGRQEAEGQGAAVRPVSRPYLGRSPILLVSSSLVLGRQGSRARRQDGGAEQQGDGRVGQVRGGLMEGCARRGRDRLG